MSPAEFFLEALLADPNLAEEFKRSVPRVSEEKREEIEHDALGEDLWLARGGRDE